MIHLPDLKMPHTDPGVNGFPLKIIHPVHEHISDGTSAFAHALALAYASRGEIEIVDLRDHNKDYQPQSVRALLEKWGHLQPNSDRSDVHKIGLRVTRIVKKGKAKRVISGRMEKHRHDILVIGTNEHHVLGTLFGHDLAEYLADAFRQTTLYVPTRAKPFVNPETGEISLGNILIPVPDAVFARSAFAFCKTLLAVFPTAKPVIFGLHCGESFPELPEAVVKSLGLQTRIASGSVVAAITGAAQEIDADLIIMATAGRNTFPKKLIGSNTEQVLHRALCPVLSVPVESHSER
jgi:nucleotide-binding universal stress UspA family protein